MVKTNKPKKKTKSKKKKQEKKEEPQKTSRDALYLLIAFGIIAIVFLGIVLIKYLPQEPEKLESVTYKNFVFTENHGFWSTDLNVALSDDSGFQAYNIVFYYNPTEVLDIPSRNYRNNTPQVFMDTDLIWITTSPETTPEVGIAGTEIARVLAQMFRKTVKVGVTHPAPGLEYPTVTCDSVGENRRVIELKVGNETRIDALSNGCVIVQGSSPNELIRAADRLTYEILKII